MIPDPKWVDIGSNAGQVDIRIADGFGTLAAVKILKITNTSRPKLAAEIILVAWAWVFLSLVIVFDIEYGTDAIK